MSKDFRKISIILLAGIVIISCNLIQATNAPSETPEAKCPINAAELEQAPNFASQEDSIKSIGKVDLSSLWIPKPEYLQESPDGMRLAYATQNGDKKSMVVDGVEGENYDYVSPPIFSPDSSRLVYRAQVGSKQVVVENGLEGKQFDGVGDITFSPNSGHVVYKGFLGEKVYLIVDGKELEQYDRIITAIFFDSPEFVHFLAIKHLSTSEDEVLLVVKKIK